MCHVSNIGVDGEDIFGLDADRERFIARLDVVVERFDVEVHAIALMSNHFHALLYSPLSDISEAMKDLQGPYARYYNWRTSRKGPLFVPRFWATAVTSDAQLIQTVRYIHRNPIDIAGTELLTTYRWSSLPAYLGHCDPDPWLTTSRLGPRLEPDRHLAHVLRPQPTDRLPYANFPPQRITTCAEIDEAVTTVAARHGWFGPQQGLRILLAEACRAGDVVTRAHHFDVAPQTLRNSARRARQRLDRDPTFARFRDRVLREMT